MGKPTDLVQGTLDLLILKTVSLEPKHGWAIAKRIQQDRGKRSRFSKVRCTRRYTGWSSRAGLRRTGLKQRRVARPSSIP
jgi:hypothetical protein